MRDYHSRAFKINSPEDNDTLERWLRVMKAQGYRILHRVSCEFLGPEIIKLVFVGVGRAQFHDGYLFWNYLGMRRMQDLFWLMENVLPEVQGLLFKEYRSALEELVRFHSGTGKLSDSDDETASRSRE